MLVPEVFLVSAASIEAARQLMPAVSFAGSVVASRIASALDRSAEARRVTRDLLENEDLARVQAAAIARRLDEVLREAPPSGFLARRWLRKLATQASTWWKAVARDEVQRWMTSLKDEELVDTLARHLADNAWRPPGSAAWVLLLEKAERVTFGGPKLTDVDRTRIADELAGHFLEDVCTVTTKDEQGFRKTVLRFLSEMLVATRGNGTADAEWSRAASSLGEVAEQLNLLAELPADVGELARKVDATHDIAAQTLQNTEELKRTVKSGRVIPEDLPPPANRFFGRVAEAAELRALLLDHEVEAAVSGTFGMGKTALAARVLREIVGEDKARLLEHFPDGSLFLNAYRDKTLEALENAIVQALGEPVGPGNARAACTQRPGLLVVLEGAETLSAKDLRDLRDVTRSVRKRLVLTRDARQVDATRSVEIFRPLSDEDSRALLSSLAPAAPEDVLAGVVECLHGYPFALTCAGSQLNWTGRESPRAFLDEMRAAPFLRLNKPGRIEETMDWLFERSLRLLGEDARNVLMGLGLLAPVPVPLAAAAAMIDSDGAPARPALLELVDLYWLRLSSTEPELWEFSHILAHQYTARAKTWGNELSSSDTPGRVTVWAERNLQRELREARTIELLPALRAAVQHAVAALVRTQWGPGVSDALATLLLFDTARRLKDLRWLSLGRECLEAVAVHHAATPESARGAEWLRSKSACLTQLGDYLVLLGELGSAGEALRESVEIDEGLLKANPESAQAARDLSVSLNKLADFLARRGQAGDAEQALSHYERSLAVAEGLLKANPESAEAARDVSVSLNKLADFLARRGRAGDAERALSHYERSLAVGAGLLKANPESAEAARDVSVSLERLGDFLARRGRAGDAERALSHYERSLAVREGLLKANPESAQAARDVSVSLNKLADFLASRGQAGDAEQALSHYERSLEFREGLLEANPESAEAARDVSVSLERLGDFLSLRGQAGDAEQALSHYERSLAVREGLLKANPESAQAARDVSVSLNKLAYFLARRGQAGDAEQALSHYERSLEVVEGLLKANPESAEAARDVSVALECLGDFLARRGQAGDAEQALSHYERSLAVREGLLKANPESAAAARDVLISFERMSKAHAEMGTTEDTTHALAYQVRSLNLARSLAESNPGAWFYARTVVVAAFLAFHRARAAGQEETAAAFLFECRQRLTAARDAGITLDPPMSDLLAELDRTFDGG